MSREWQISNLKNVVRKEIWEINEEWQIRNLKNVGWKEIWEVNEEWQIRNLKNVVWKKLKTTQNNSKLKKTQAIHNNSK